MPLTEHRAGIREVREPHRFDVARLQAYLRDKIPEAARELNVHQFEGGQSNPTYLLETSGKRYVLRRKPPGTLLPSAHAVDREFRVISALQDTRVPVPKAICYCADEAVVGTPFYIMEYVEGRQFWSPDLPELDPRERAGIYDAMNRVIADLHCLNPDEIGLADFGKRGNYVARQITRWTSQYRASQTENIEAMERLIEWLPLNVPADEPVSLTHGDFRLDNMIFHPHEPRILAVLDWELATIGNPLADFAYHCTVWRLPHTPHNRLEGLDLAALGIPTEAEYVQRYCERTSRSGIAGFDFYIAFNLFRLAAILQGVAARALAGNASSAHALETGRMARPIAEYGWAQALRVTPRQNEDVR
jgi:aminoglycoside phosphotransferase (APT) family kinase protein